MRVRLHPLYDMEGEIGASAPESATEPSSVVTEGQEPSGDGNAPAPAEEAQEDVTKQESFAKRLSEKLAEERAKIEAEFKEKYGDYEAMKDVAEYFREANGFDDVLSLKERIEMERLQSRAEKEGISPEMQRRLEQLEERARRADELEQQRQAEEQQRQEQERLTQFYKEFRGNIETFAKENGANADELERYMIDNEIKKIDVAYKAMKAEEYEKKLQEREQDVIKRYLDSKNAPRVEGTGAAGLTSFKPTGNLDAASERALARFRAAKQSS